MKQTLEEAVNEIGGVHPDWDKITCYGSAWMVISMTRTKVTQFTLQ